MHFLENINIYVHPAFVELEGNGSYCIYGGLVTNTMIDKFESWLIIAINTKLKIYTIFEYTFSQDPLSHVALVVKSESKAIDKIVRDSVLISDEFVGFTYVECNLFFIDHNNKALQKLKMFSKDFVYSSKLFYKQIGLF